MILMDIEQQVMDRILEVYKIFFDYKGYGFLSSHRDAAKNRTSRFFGRNGYNPQQILMLINKFDTAVIRYLEEYVMNRGSRPLRWPDYHDDSLRNEMLYELLLSTSPQES